MRNPDLAPHLTFVDVGLRGYATVRVDASTMVTEFVCIPRPLERSATPGRRAAALPRPPRSSAVEGRRAAEDAADGGGGRSGTGCVRGGRRTKKRTHKK